jgi:hypothetical protein
LFAAEVALLVACARADNEPFCVAGVGRYRRRVRRLGRPRRLFVYIGFGISTLSTVVKLVKNIVCTLRSGTVPSQWLTAVITPVPKISAPSTLSDFRPISVTPILCRTVEKLVVSRWLRPAITQDLISDQFAFRPTGSTTCALVFFMHHVTRMLETNAYVRCLLVDFSKAFDRVDHVVLAEKLSKLKLPSYVLNWLISFLTGRSHTTKNNCAESRPLPINLSIVKALALALLFTVFMKVT